MKIFFYKSLLIFFLSFILIQFTINLALKDFKEQIYELRKEIKNGIQSENYLSDDDAQLINDFFKKIQKELDNQK